MLTIRLQRTGKRNRPDFRIIITEKTAAASKKFLEILGSYNPRTKELVIKNTERLQYWVSQHVAMSATIHNLFVSKGFVTAAKVKAFKTPKKEVKAEESAPVAETKVEETTPEVEQAA